MGIYHIYSFKKILRYCELSIYVLLLKFGLLHRYNIQYNLWWLFLIFLDFDKSCVWYIFVFTQYGYHCDFFFWGPASCLRERHCHGWVRYIDTTKITVLRFVWYRLFFTQYSYYREFFCSGPASSLRNRHRHVWVRYIDTTIITVWCISSLLLSIDLQWFCYAMVKWWMVKCFNGEIKISISRFVSHKY